MMTREQFEAHVRAEAERRYPEIVSAKVDEAGTIYRDDRQNQREAYIAARMEHEWPLVAAAHIHVFKYINDEQVIVSSNDLLRLQNALSPYTTKPVEP